MTIQALDTQVKGEKMSDKYNWYNSVWTIQHIRNGKVIWSDEGRNSLMQQGEESILETFFRNDSNYAPAHFYVRLCNYTPLVTDTLTSIQSEPSGNGYSAQLIERSAVGFSTKDLTSNGTYRLTSKVLTFTASGGDIGPVTNAFLATSSDNTGRAIAFRALSQTRTIQDGDSLTCTFKIDLG